MGHGNGIKWYRHIQLPGTGIEAVNECLAVAPSRPPGSPDEFYSAATRLGQRAQALREVLDKLRAIDATEGVWTGDAADAFRNVIRDAHSSHYDQVPVRYDGYAQALRRYGSELYGHQATIDGARADVQAALDAYHRAQTSAPPMKPGMTTCPTPYSHLPNFAPPGAACTSILDDCLAAARRFQTAYNNWVDAVTTCEHAIERVDDDKLHNPHGAQVAVDAIANVSGLLANVTAALAVLTLYWPPVALMFLELSTVFSIIQLGADITRKVAWDENVTGMDFAIDALGSIPLVAPIHEGVAAGRASTSVRSLGKLRAGFQVAGRTFRDEATALGRAVKELKSSGLWRTLRHPDPRLGANVIKVWDAQDAAALGAQIGQQGFNDRKQGYRQAITRSTFSVVLGPLDLPVLTVLDKLAGATRGPRPAPSH